MFILYAIPYLSIALLENKLGFGDGTHRNKRYQSSIRQPRQQIQLRKVQSSARPLQSRDTVSDFQDTLPTNLSPHATCQGFSCKSTGRVACWSKPSSSICWVFQEKFYANHGCWGNLPSLTLRSALVAMMLRWPMYPSLSLRSPKRL